MAYIRKRGAKWYYTIEIGSKTRKRKEVPGGATRQEAEAAYARALVSLEVNGGYVEPMKKTVAEFFAEWLSDDVSINTHKNTVRSYRSSLRITFALPSATASFALSVRRCSNSS